MCLFLSILFFSYFKSNFYAIFRFISNDGYLLLAALNIEKARVMKAQNLAHESHGNMNFIAFYGKCLGYRSISLLQVRHFVVA